MLQGREDGFDWISKLAEQDYDQITLEQRLEILQTLVHAVMEGPSVRCCLDHRLEESQRIRKQMWEEAKVSCRHDCFGVFALLTSSAGHALDGEVMHAGLLSDNHSLHQLHACTRKESWASCFLPSSCCTAAGELCFHTTRRLDFAGLIGPMLPRICHLPSSFRCFFQDSQAMASPGAQVHLLGLAGSILRTCTRVQSLCIFGAGMTFLSVREFG